MSQDKPEKPPFYVHYEVQELYGDHEETVWVNDAVIVLETAHMPPDLLASILATFPNAFSLIPNEQGELWQELSYHRSWPYALTPDSLRAFIYPHNLPKQQ